MRLLIQTLLRLVAGTYFVLTSLYCLLAFLPYTYTAFIKAPPYPWMPQFAHHQAGLYWLATAAGVAAQGTFFQFWRRKDLRSILPVGMLAAFGVYLTLHPFLPGIQSNRTAYWWSLVSLLPVIGLALWRSSSRGPANEEDQPEATSFGYSSGIIVALVVSAIYLLGSQLQVYRETHAVGVQRQFVDIALWSLVSHLAVAMAVLSGLNLIFLVASKTPKPATVRRWLVGTSIVAGLWIVLERFLDTAMSFDGWSAYCYALALALSLTLWGFSLVLPFHEGRKPDASKFSAGQSIATWTAVALLIAVALMSRSLIGGEDWNGMVASTWALIFWIAMSLCAYRLRPVRASYSAAAILATLLAGAFIYKGLQFTQIFWSKPLGSTEDDISLTLEEYGGHDASFLLAHHVLGNGRQEGCRDLCRILREYTNVRDTHISQGVKLVDNLVPTPGQRPNIFIFVVDSMRPDYLGAYNSHVDYTPNLDALARDSIVFRRTHTHYAGTSISEPAIWAGAELLHTHFPQPFDEVNSLRTLARTDGYELTASYDTVLKQLFTPSDELTRLDTDKDLWNRYEACSTVSELESHLDSRTDKSRPVLFYTQPMNVHQFARNDVPSPTSQHWPDRRGLNTRITYEVHWVDSCLGGFFNYLKQRGLYDDSIIVVTSDHGDATGEFGRFSHSTSIWPEIMRVPLMIHLPPKLRARLVYDDTRLSTLTDITPTLYYLLGHRPIRQNPLYGRPLLVEHKQELDAYPARDLLLASDVRAVYGILTSDGRYLYATYDSPAQSYLFDLNADPDAQHSILTDSLKQHYDEQIIEHLQMVGDYYGYKPGVGSLLASTSH
ncbi:MAG TPA: sulfatase-like hydrolase/transferase [Candidatus Dormibacteraeota bacterium]|nr:sulfatase-like hydrolase/transferase [Candidatus Dormibacteraeota bacterium]